MYLTYQEYQEMGGTLEESTFNDYEFRAEAFVNYATFDRLTKDTVIPDKVKRVIKSIIDLVQKKADALSLGNSGGSSSGNVYLTSQSNDGVSASYNGMAPTDVFGLCDAEIQRTVQIYLYGVKNEAGKVLLYRGLYKGE